MTARDVEAEAEGWRCEADVLAAWCDAHLVNRRDVWGGYWPHGMRETLGKIRTAPRVVDRGRHTLTADVLRRHFEGRDVGDVCGLHTTSTDNTSRWLALDFDTHGTDVTLADRARVANAAEWCTEQLAERGAGVLLECSDGGGGQHVWVRFEAPVATADVFAWLTDLVDRCADAMDVRPETFPKQATVPDGAFGNWVRLPGRHHTRAHWSRLARPGTQWVSGADAASLLLTDWPATPAAAVPPASVWPQPEPTGAPMTRYPMRCLADVPRDRARVIARYCANLPHGAEGTARSDRLFALARFLRHGMHCTTDEALPIIQAWNAGNTPPLGDAKVRTTWANAERYASTPLHLRISGGRRAA